VFSSGNSLYNGANLNDAGINPVTGTTDPYGASPPPNVESVDLRLTFTF
jgi:hypothetical protein